jgi:hypothetical protein
LCSHWERGKVIKAFNLSPLDQLQNKNNKDKNSVAIGFYAGQYSQGASLVSI